jgi:hypothetical protein
MKEGLFCHYVELLIAERSMESVDALLHFIHCIIGEAHIESILSIRFKYVSLELFRVYSSTFLIEILMSSVQNERSPQILTLTSFL